MPYPNGVDLTAPGGPYEPCLPADVEDMLDVLREADETGARIGKMIEQMQTIMDGFYDRAINRTMPGDAKRRAEMARDGLVQHEEHFATMLRVLKGEVQ